MRTIKKRYEPLIGDLILFYPFNEMDLGNSIILSLNQSSSAMAIKDLKDLLSLMTNFIIKAEGECRLSLTPRTEKITSNS